MASLCSASRSRIGTCGLTHSGASWLRWPTDRVCRCAVLRRPNDSELQLAVGLNLAIHTPVHRSGHEATCRTPSGRPAKFGMIAGRCCCAQCPEAGCGTRPIQCDGMARAWCVRNPRARSHRAVATCCPAASANRSPSLMYVHARFLGNVAHHHYRFNESKLALAACEQALLNVDDLEIHDLAHPGYFVQERSVPQEYTPPPLHAAAHPTICPPNRARLPRLPRHLAERTLPSRNAHDVMLQHSRLSAEATARTGLRTGGRGDGRSRRLPPQVRPRSASHSLVGRRRSQGREDRSRGDAAVHAIASELARGPNPSSALPLRCRRVLSARASDQRHLHPAGPRGRIPAHIWGSPHRAPNEPVETCAGAASADELRWWRAVGPCATRCTGRARLRLDPHQRDV